MKLGKDTIGFGCLLSGDFVTVYAFFPVSKNDETNFRVYNQFWLLSEPGVCSFSRLVFFFLEKVKNCPPQFYIGTAINTGSVLTIRFWILE